MLKERLEQVLEAIRRLDEPNRTLLEEHDLKEVSISELSMRYKMTEEGIKSRLKRARSEVREKLIRETKKI